MKKIIRLIVLLVCVFGALYLYIDTDAPTISWGVENNESINHALNIDIADDIGFDEVCFSLSGGACTGEERCSTGLQSQSFKLLIEPDKCLVNAEPLEIKVTINAVDSSPVSNTTSSSINLIYDNQAPSLMTLNGSRSLQQGGSGVVLYEVGEVPRKTGVMLDDLLFRAFEFEKNKYLSFYAHPYNVEADEFRPRVFAVDAAGNTRKIRPGSRTASYAYRKEVIELTDAFLETVKDKMMSASPRTALDVFLEINNQVREENYEKISQICQATEPKKLWQGAFLRNLGATKAGFADDRTYRYNSEVVSRQVHLGIDIAGVNHNEILAANHGKVIFVGEIGIYGNVVVLDHGYGLHSLYGHLSQAKVRQGDYVRKGDLIALSGDSGLVFGDHLHFEMRVNGVPVNPIEWFDEVWVKNNIESYLPGAEEEKGET